MALLSDKFKLKPQLSGADIKSLYEVEADTNAYTDAEKTKLAGIANGAEVNVNADWNAVSGDSQILNKPTLGTAAATDSTDYATAAQGTLADTALQPDQTETISGDYTFNGALILPNNSRINGTEHFYQTTKPTVRGDSSALVAGDRWWKTDDGTEWSWNGTYWLSEEKQFYSTINGNPTGNFSFTFRYWFFSSDLYLSRLELKTRLNLPFTQGWELHFQIFNKSNSGSPVGLYNDTVIFKNLDDTTLSNGFGLSSFVKNHAFVGDYSCMQLEVNNKGGSVLIQPTITIFYNKIFV